MFLYLLLSHRPSPTLFSISLLRLLTPFVIRLGTPEFRRYMLRFVPIPAVHKVKEMSDVMERTCRRILDKKRESRKIEKKNYDNDDRDERDVMSVLRRLPVFSVVFLTDLASA